jgi:hypothetical protein
MRFGPAIACRLALGGGALAAPFWDGAMDAEILALEAGDDICLGPAGNYVFLKQWDCFGFDCSKHWWLVSVSDGVAVPIDHWGDPLASDRMTWGSDGAGRPGGEGVRGAGAETTHPVDRATRPPGWPSGRGPSSSADGSA